MNKRVEFIGAPINIPYVLSGIQSNVEKYFGDITKSFIRKGGIIAPFEFSNVESIPCRIYLDESFCKISSGYIAFPNFPYPVINIASQNICEVGVFSSQNSTYYIYARYRILEYGNIKHRASGFVYGDNLGTTYKDQIVDSVEFEVSPVKLSSLIVNRILIGTVYTNMSQQNAAKYNFSYYSSHGLTINQRAIIINPISGVESGAEFAELNIYPRFYSNKLILNSAKINLEEGGVQIFVNSEWDKEYAEFFINPVSTGVYPFRWLSNIPIAGPDPINSEDFTTKQWVENYITDLLYVVPNVINFKVTNISPLSERTRKLLGDNQGLPTIIRGLLDLSLSWGYDTLYGVGQSGTNRFIIPNIIGAQTGDFDGLYLWLPTFGIGGKNLKIINSEVTESQIILTLSEVNGSSFVFNSTFTISSDSPLAERAWIHMNASAYQIQAVPCTVTGGLISFLNFEHAVTITVGPGNPTPLRTKISLNHSEYYRIAIRAIKGNHSGNWTFLNSGSFIKNFNKSGTSQVVTYDYPYYVSHPIIFYVDPQYDDQEPVTSVTTTGGFKININPNYWQDAEEFEIIYAPKGTTLDFSNVNLQRVFSISRTVVINNTPTIDWYDFKVRPIVGGQQVCTNNQIAFGRVFSGSDAGQNAQVISQFNCDLKTYRGIIGMYSTQSPYDQFKFNSLYTPVISGLERQVKDSDDDTLIPANLQYKFLKITELGNQEVVLVPQSTYIFKLWSPLLGEFIEGNSGTTYVFNSGLTKLSRRILTQSGFTKSWKITKIDVNVFMLHGGPVNLRVFDEENESANDNVNIISQANIGNTVSFNISEQSDVIIEAGNKMIVDLWDPNLLYNNTGLTAFITIYAVPYVRSIKD